VLADGEIDAVIDCGPSVTRADLAVAALRAGKHVVLEAGIVLADLRSAQSRRSPRRDALAACEPDPARMVWLRPGARTPLLMGRQVSGSRSG
jgi:hypothetical protein